MIRHVKSVPTASRSLAQAFCMLRMLCLALLQAVQGVPRWTHQTKPAETRLKTNFWTPGLSKLYTLPAAISKGGHDFRPIPFSSNFTCSVSLPAPENSSRKPGGPAWLNAPADVTFFSCSHCPSSVETAPEAALVGSCCKTGLGRLSPCHLDGASAGLPFVDICLMCKPMDPHTKYAAALRQTLLIPPELLRPSLKARIETIESERRRHRFPRLCVVRHRRRMAMRQTLASLILICSEWSSHFLDATRSHFVESPQVLLIGGIE